VRAKRSTILSKVGQAVGSKKEISFLEQLSKVRPRFVRKCALRISELPYQLEDRLLPFLRDTTQKIAVKNFALARFIAKKDTGRVCRRVIKYHTEY
jgi:hypothetical protein